MKGNIIEALKKVLNIAPYITGPVLILLFWKNTILNIGSKIHDWYDGAFIIWTMQNNIKHFQTLDFMHLFETNAMYPFTNTLSFTDHLFIPSFFAFIISFFNRNPLFQFNILSIFNHLLVFVSFYFLAGRFTKNNWIKMITALYGSFSPYFFSQFGHFQMVFMWPLVFSIFFLLDPKKQNKRFILTGVFLGIQFLTGVYLGLIGLTMVGLYYIGFLVVHVIPTKRSAWRDPSTSTFELEVFARDDKKKREVVIQNIRDFCIFFVSFFIISFPSIFGYLKVNMQYKPVREQSEFVTYSAHITDYALVTFNNSWFNRKIFQPMIGKYNQHNRGEMAGFVGTLPLLVIGYWLLVTGYRLFIMRKIIDSNLDPRPSPRMTLIEKEASFPRRRESILKLWLILLIFVGFVFSLGPRFNWNGKYLVTPLPYWVVMKSFPPITIMRAVARWYFLVIFAVTIIMTFGLNHFIDKYKKNSVIILALFVLGFFIEFYPAPIQVNAKNWMSPAYLFLQKECMDKPGAVLEYPFEYRYKSKDIGTYLSLKTNTLMSSTLHNCPTLSGFSSFEPPLFKQWQKEFDENGITDNNIKILKSNKFVFVKVNFEALSKEEKLNPVSVIHTTHLKEVFRDSYSIIYKITD